MFAAIPFPDISPEIFSVTVMERTFSLRWYAMGYVIGIFLGMQIVRMALTRPVLWNGAPPFQKEKIDDLLTYIIVGVILGGRLGYVLFYKPAEYLANPIEIIKIWEGGLSFHGGFLGVILAVYLFSRRNNVALSQLADLIAVSATPAILLVRCTNFINAELWGRPTELPWGVIFPGAAAQSCATLTESCARHPSQLYEAGLEGLLLGTVLLVLAFRFGALKKPWLLTGTFFLGYGLSRFLVEFVRQPDAQFQSIGNELGLAFHYHGYGLTMGQTLTLPMIIIGAALVVRAAKR